MTAGATDHLAISVEGLRKCYGAVVAVDGVDLDVRRGEILGIIGPNGCGKTTTVECLQGLRKPDSGRLDVLGFDPTTQRARLRARVGSQLQASALPDRLRVAEALELFSQLSPLRPDWRPALDRWDLAPLRNASFASLSGGQRQRLFVALALLGAPELVFLDEMTTGLDPAARRVVWELVREIRASGTTVVLVTHFMDEAEQLCDRVAVMRSGQVVAVGGPEALVREVAPEVVVRFSVDAGTEVAWLASLDEVDDLSWDGAGVVLRGRGPVLAVVAHALVDRGIVPDDLRAERATLEDVYLRLTGGEQAAG